jgi:hypothetical protein
MRSRRAGLSGSKKAKRAGDRLFQLAAELGVAREQLGRRKSLGGVQREQRRRREVRSRGARAVELERLVDAALPEQHAAEQPVARTKPGSTAIARRSAASASPGRISFFSTTP